MPELTVRGATGLLAAFDEAGVLAPADIHVATRLGALALEPDERVLLALALTVRGTRHGSVVLDLADAAETTAPDLEDLDEAGDDTDAGTRGSDPGDLPWPPPAQWAAACKASPLVTEGLAGGPVLRMLGTRLWLDRYWHQEQQVADDLRQRAGRVPADLDDAQLDRDLAELFGADADADQRAATAAAARAGFAVIGGGPGTGKTTTVARLIAILLRQSADLRIALAAPTGKAAARLQEAIRDAAADLPAEDRARLERVSAGTVHRLLGNRPGVRSRFRHDRDNHLPLDVVVVDESSMMPLTITARLLEALAPATRLVLVGDPDQLASVEAGAVLGDIVEAGLATTDTSDVDTSDADTSDADTSDADTAGTAGPLRESVRLLRTVHRFDAGGPIARLAEHVRTGDVAATLAMLREGIGELEFHDSGSDDDALPAGAQAVLREQAGHELEVVAAARAGDTAAALGALDRHRLLCAHRGGPRGVRFWSDQLERRVSDRDPLIAPRADGFYAGQPLLVTSNDYDNELWNGDTGVVVDIGDELVAAFGRGARPLLVPLVRLSDVRPLHAMTIHRAQGSQFDEVTVLLPAATSPLATRQTFYTAITRASRRVRIVGSEAAVEACVARTAARATGLRERLSEP